MTGNPRHRPQGDRPIPRGTYRLQIRPEFGFGDAADVVDYLNALGASHAYLSPVLQPTPGSAHGYDVVDHSRLSSEAGGREAFDRLIGALHAAGMGAVADVVPNHMAVPTPASLNAALWSVLRDGPESPFARWFDVDWAVPDRALLMPVLGRRIGQVLGDGELTLDLDGTEPLLRYYDHVFPVRPGTESLPMAELVDRQWYRLAHWRVADEELNYRRFFDVDTLAGVRVEDPEVFDATHELLLSLVASGALDGLRIDHPDGLYDPRGYLRRLAERTDGCWVVVEKILEGHEELPDDWPCAGTTGYDALLRVGGLFVDPQGAHPLTMLLHEVSGDSQEFEDIVEQAKREIIEHGLYAEVLRLADLLVEVCHSDVRLRDHTARGLRECLVELLVAFDRYRAYVVPGEPAPGESVAVMDRAVERARTRLPEDRWDTLDLVRDLLLGREAGSAGRIAEAARTEAIVRFQQTCGPVMAKAVEDTSFYRWHRLSALNEVGGDPLHFGVSPEEFHAFSSRLAREWPTSMTTLSTHDTKRSEDVRARLAVLSEVPNEWAEAVRAWRELAEDHRSSRLDGSTEYLLWQTLVGTWSAGPLPLDRLLPYLQKAVREAKQHTSWTAQEPEYEDAVRSFAVGVLGDAAVLDAVGSFCRSSVDAPARVGILGQKLVQLTMPGVPDVYQGSDLVDLSLVDPDNRRPVDYGVRRARLRALDGGARPGSLDDEKLLVTSRALRLRRDRPEWFVGPEASYAPLPTSTGNAVAFVRGDAGGPSAVTLATRLPVALARLGGWQQHTVALPSGAWRDLLTGRDVKTDEGSAVMLADVLSDLPVALLVRG